MQHQYVRDLKIGPLKMDEKQDGCFSVQFEFYPKPVEEIQQLTTVNLEQDKVHQEVGKQLMHLMNGVRANKNPEKFLKTHGDANNRFKNNGRP